MLTTGGAAAGRRVRITLRCLTEDLGRPIPPPEVDLGETSHPIVDEARRIAASAPRGQKRILSIDHPLVYRLRHSNLRGATWLDEGRNVLWVLAVEAREQGSDDDAFSYFAGLHAAGELLPTADDDLRDRVEAAARLLRTIRTDLSEALAHAHRSLDAEQTVSLGGYVPSRLYVRRSGNIEELWLAVATRDATGRGIKPELRDHVFAILADLVEAADWEWRTDWPVGGLQWFEVARLGISAAPEP